MLARKIETLTDLLAQAEDYANFSMWEAGSVPAALFWLGTAGPFMFEPGTLPDVPTKNEFAENARLLCLAHAATAVALVYEAWTRPVLSPEEFDPTESISQAIDRQEIVVISGESRRGQKGKILPIIRSDNGNFFGFGTPRSLLPDKEGRFAQLLAPPRPAAEDCLLAKAVLKEKGVIAHILRPPRPRRRPTR